MTVSDATRQRFQQRPPGKPVMYQSWRKLLFLHWRVVPDRVQQWLPEGLTVDTFDGSAWVGVVPFLMRNIRPVWSPTVPYISNFLELNVRTYAIDEQGTPGVWFISLNANRWLAVRVARWWYHLPYFTSAMSVRFDADGWIDYRCRRYGVPRNSASRFRYRGLGNPQPAAVGTLEFFLAERYVLFSQLADGGLATGRVHHVPYPLQRTEVALHDDHQWQVDGLGRPRRPFDHACYTEGVDVDVFGLQQPC